MKIEILNYWDNSKESVEIGKAISDKLSEVFYGSGVTEAMGQKIERVIEAIGRMVQVLNEDKVISDKTTKKIYDSI